METSTGESRKWKLDLVNASFLSGIPVLAVIGLVWYSINHGVSFVELSIFGFMYIATGLSITAGYHRLFSHRTHKGAWPLRLFYALFGAAAFQNSAIKWCSDHRRHHLVTDTEDDPYSVLKGFFWAHIGWVMVAQEDGANVEKVDDLEADSILAFQDRHIFLLGFLVGMVLPGVLGWLFLGGVTGFLGGFIWGGLFRVVIVHHATFLINSAAHTWGTQPYTTANTSRDSPLLSLFTYGEGYHNFHHAFQADYRNGHKWHHWDPTKWWIGVCSLIKMTSSLHKTPTKTIESRKMETAYENSVGLGNEEHKKYAQSFIEQLRKGYTQLDTYRKELKNAKRNKEGKSRYIDLKKEIKLAKVTLSQLRDEFNQWINGLPTAAA
jgi:stearoyl-CoA desaturase (delta-9 desaturase)